MTARLKPNFYLFGPNPVPFGACTRAKPVLSGFAISQGTLSKVGV